MINRYKLNGQTWIDIFNAEKVEIDEIMKEFSIHSVVTKELSLKTPKPRIEVHEKYLYAVLHFPAYKHTHSDEINQEMDFIVGKDFVITTRYDNIDSLHKLNKKVEVEEVLEKTQDKNDKHIFIKILREMYLGQFEELDHIENQTEGITRRIFKGEEKEMVVAISEITRNLLNLERVINLHDEILSIIKEKGNELFGEKFSNEMEEVMLDYMKINTNIKFNLDILRELRNTNNSMLTSKQNEIVKQLTVMGFVILPLNLIAWVFAMRVEGLPFLDNPNGFLIVSVLMLTSALVTLTYAKHKGWM